MAWLGGASVSPIYKKMLESDDIVPGSEPSYQLCKEIYMYHPLGAKLAEKPITIAQSQSRAISIPDSPEERVRDAFITQWREDGCDRHIFNTFKLARIYGIATASILVAGLDSAKPLDINTLWEKDIAYNEFDPLNTAGSLVLNQNPNAMDFLKTTEISVQGQRYHRSRSCVILNEEPIYIGYTSSGFGFVGRSVYQRSLFPLKSFLDSLITDDMVVRKAGLLIAKVKPAGSIASNMMGFFTQAKATFLKLARSDNVLTINPEEFIESIDLKNLDGAYGICRKNLLENIAASSDDMPAKLLTAETFVEGFGEGTEDAKAVAAYIDRFREKMGEIYRFFDRITQHRAWNPEFYATIQKEFPEYRRIKYENALYQWRNSFVSEWPSLLTEPPSEKVKVDDVKLRALIALLEVIPPMLDPENRVQFIMTALDNVNELTLMFQSPFTLDEQSLLTYAVEQHEAQPEEPPEQKPERLDSVVNGLKARLRLIEGSPLQDRPTIDDVRNLIDKALRSQKVA